MKAKLNEYLQSLSQIPEVSVDQAKQLENAVWLDAREDHEYAAGHVPGAISCPCSRMEFELGQHADELADADKVVVYCGSGKRSLLACERLQKLGLNNVVSMAGGYAAWND